MGYPDLMKEISGLFYNLPVETEGGYEESMDAEIIPDTGICQMDCKDFRLVRVKGVSNYYVTLRNNGGHCPECGSYVTKVKDYVRKKIVLDKDRIIFYKARRFVCKCKKAFYEENPFSNERKKVSDHLIKCILGDLKRYNHTYLEVAEKYGISVTEVMDIFDRHVQIERKSLREVVSFDEFYFSRHSRNKYAFMILGLNGEILDILPSRHKNKLLDYFKYIPEKERDRVKYVTMDMYENYRVIVRRRLKNAVICIDSFHVMEHINNALDEVRLFVLRRYSKNQKSDEYYLLKTKRHVLFKEGLSEEYEYNNHFRMKMNDYDYLSLILKIDPALSAAYELMKRYYYFNHYWNEHTREEAYEYIRRYIDECYLLNLSSFEELGNTLNNWKQEIANSFIPYTKRNGETVRLSNGKIEGKNSYIKKMIRLANGYGNFKRFRNRVIYCENYYEIYSEKALPNTVRRRFPPKKKDT